MKIDDSCGSVRLELQDLVGNHWPANGKVTVRSIPGGVEITWQTATENRVAETSALQFLHDPKYPQAGWDLCYIEDPDPIPPTPQLPQWAVCPFVVQEWSPSSEYGPVTNWHIPRRDA